MKQGFYSVNGGDRCRTALCEKSGILIEKGFAKNKSGCNENPLHPLDLANLPLVDTMHHALTAWCIFAGFILTHWDNGDRRDKMRSILLFHSAVSMFFGVPQQIQESKRRNSQQISATFRVVNAKIIGILCNNNCCR